MNYWGYLAGYGYMALLLLCSEVLCRKTRIPREVMRKVLHCLIGFEYLALYFFFPTSPQIVVIPLSFIFFNALTYRFNFLKSIERKEGNHLGIVYYAVAMSGMAIATAVHSPLLYPFGVAVFCLSFGDGAAALCGKYIKPRIIITQDKTLFGAIGCYVFAFAGQCLLNAILSLPFRFDVIAIIALVCTLAECFSSKGLDNIFVCLWCMLFAVALYLQPQILYIVTLAFLSYLLCAITYLKGAFTFAASVTAGIILFAVGLHSRQLATLLLATYLTVWIADKIAPKREHHAPRTVMQIIHNAFAPLVCVAASALSGKSWLLVAAAIGFAESMCDSVASAIGKRSKSSPVHILSHTSTPSGESGGITLLGSLSAVVVNIPITALCLLFAKPLALIPVFLLPVGGMFLDSVFGASIQAKFRCPTCEIQTERAYHCGRPTIHATGLPWMSNSRVNFLTNILTTVAGILCVAFI